MQKICLCEGSTAILMVINDIHCRKAGEGYIDSYYPFLGITSEQWEDSIPYTLKKGIWKVEIDELEDDWTTINIPDLKKVFVLTKFDRLVAQGYVRVLQEEDDVCA